MKISTHIPVFFSILLLGCTSTTQAAQDSVAQDSVAKPAIATPSASPVVMAKTEAKSEAKPEAKTEAKSEVQSNNTVDRVTITPKTATFTWRRPDSDPKSTSRSDVKNAKLRYPTVTGLADSSLQDKIQTAIDLKSAFGKSITEMEAEFQENHWMEKMDYEVNYNDRGILSLTYSGYGVGAYPSGFVRYRSVNLRNGEALRPHDFFKTEALGAIALMVDRQLQQAIQTKVAELDKDDNAKDIDRAIFRAHRFRIKHLNDFTVTPEGVIFHYRFGFPHVILAAEPKGDFLIPHAELKSYLRANSPIAGLD
jgi:Deacetylase PdaC